MHRIFLDFRHYNFCIVSEALGDADAEMQIFADGR